MESKMNCAASGASDLVLIEGQQVNAGSYQCTMLRFLGEGTFGKVALFKDNQTGNTMAVKIPRKELAGNVIEELAVLNALSVLDPDTVNIIRYYGCFYLQGSVCLAFETLDRSLDDLVGTQQKPLLCGEIRPIAKQLLEALDALKGIGIVHTDIKPDNVMVVSAGDRPLRVKLIDFGLAMPVSSIRRLMEVQVIGYRAPEVFLGQEFDEAIDVWAVGCVLAFLYLGIDLFPSHCEYVAIKNIFRLLGEPDNERLCKGRFTRRFFTEKDKAALLPDFRLMTPAEYFAYHNVPVGRQYFTSLPSSLDGLLEFHRLRDAADTEDRRGLLDFLKELLQVDGPKRITPHQALQHSYLTTSERSHSPADCLDASQDVEVLSLGQLETPEHTLSPSTASETSSDSAIALREQLEVPCCPPAVPVASLDSAISLGEQLEVPCCPPAVPVASLDSAIALEEQLEVPCCPPAVPVASLDSAISLGEQLEVPCCPPAVPVASLDSAVGLAELFQSGSSDSASSSCEVQQEEDAVSLSHIQLSRSEGEPPSSASTGRFRRTLKRIRRFFRRVHMTMCCGTSLPTD